jgi:hypothetical protein
MFDASLMPEDFRPSHVFEKEVLLNYAAASRLEVPAKRPLPICNSNKARRRLMRKQEALNKAADTELKPFRVPRDRRNREGMPRH